MEELEDSPKDTASIPVPRTGTGDNREMFRSFEESASSSSSVSLRIRSKSVSITTKLLSLEPGWICDDECEICFFFIDDCCCKDDWPCLKSESESDPSSNIR